MTNLPSHGLGDGKLAFRSSRTRLADDELRARLLDRGHPVSEIDFHCDGCKADACRNVSGLVIRKWANSGSPGTFRWVTA